MKKLIMANWKMRLNYKKSLVLAAEFTKSKTLKESKHEIAICPDYLSLAAISQILKKTKIGLGSQDSSLADYGAYTGEISPSDLKYLRVKYSIIGHSERREYLHENSSILNLKIAAALNSGLIPVLCIGEKLSEKEEGRTRNYLSEELHRALKGIKIKSASDLIIAYEPVWAISTNRQARPIPITEAVEIHKFIKMQASKTLKRKVRVIYGGSVNGSNAHEFLKQKDIDGLLVGASSLKINEFNKIC